MTGGGHPGSRRSAEPASRRRRRRALLWRREYTFTPPKTSRARRAIDLPAFVVAFLRRHREEQKVRSLGSSDVVIDNGVGEPLAPWTASADFRRIIGELELPRTRFHDLRHAHAMMRETER